MSLKEKMFVFLLVGGLLVPAALVGQWWLFLVFVVFFVCFGLVEWIATAITGETVSQKYWRFSESHPVKAWLVLSCMLIAWLALLFHLGSRLF